MRLNNKLRGSKMCMINCSLTWETRLWLRSVETRDLTRSLADIKRQEDKEANFPGRTLTAAVLMQTSATVWTGSSVLWGPVQRPLTYITMGNRGVRPLSSAPFTKQPLWKEARIRIIMWTLATVYQQVCCSEWLDCVCGSRGETTRLQAVGQFHQNLAETTNDEPINYNHLLHRVTMTE